MVRATVVMGWGHGSSHERGACTKTRHVATYKVLISTHLADAEADARPARTPRGGGGGGGVEVEEASRFRSLLSRGVPGQTNCRRCGELVENFHHISISTRTTASHALLS